MGSSNVWHIFFKQCGPLLPGFTQSLQHNGSFAGMSHLKWCAPSTAYQHCEMDLSSLSAEDVRRDFFQTQQLINVPNVSEGKLPQPVNDYPETVWNGTMILIWLYDKAEANVLMRAWDKAAEDGIAGAFGMKLLVGLGAWCPTSERHYRYD